MVVVALQKSIFPFAVERVGRIVKGPEMRIAEDVSRTGGFISVATGRVPRFQVPPTVIVKLIIVPGRRRRRKWTRRRWMRRRRRSRSRRMRSRRRKRGRTRRCQ